MQAIYEVPVISNNLRHEETIVQIADVLSYLCDVFNDIVTKVNNRIDEDKVRLSNLTERINSSTEKISKLAGSKKATQVFSSSKYPAVDVHKRYKSVFTKTTDEIHFTRTKMKFQDLALSEYPLEKLQFYHVKMSDKYKRKSNFADVGEGLGAFPDDIESINELLLFNTSKNPYKNYVMSDPLQEIQHTKEINETNAPGPDAAPLSITQRSALNRSVRENYFYSPGLGDVPTIDVPLDLPDLPGIADDLRYLMESGPAIAPSVTTTPVVPDLPSVVQSPNDVSVTDLNTVTLNDTLPPLPTPTVEVPEIEESQEMASPQEKEISAAPEEPAGRTEKQFATKPLPDIPNARASLMAAIRKAGGAKKANLRNTEPNKEEKSFSSGSNLMADLNAKLALRRKGISGSKVNDGSEMNSALNRVSAMIPPPPLTSSEPNESTNTEDEDWD